MRETHFFRVAEQTFAVTGEAQRLLLMHNMAPFRVSQDDAREVLFNLQVDEVDSFASHVELQHFFTDCTEKDMPRLEVYRSERQWLIRVAQTADAPICCELLTDNTFNQARLAILKGQSAFAVRFAIDNAVMLLYAFTTAHLSMLEMHAAVVAHEGKAYLFLGHSGTGKSTHARQWLAQYHQAYLLNDDNPVLRFDAAGKLWVFGTPWSGKTPCYRNERLPVKAIIQLEQAPKNEMEEVTPSQAYAYILSSCSGMKILHDAMNGIHETISRVVFGTRIAKLRCLPDKESAQLCFTYTNSTLNATPE